MPRRAIFAAGGAAARATSWRIALAAAGLVAPSLAWAQPADLPIAPATTDKYPPGVKVARLGGGAVYTDAKGRTLYGMDMRVLLRSGPDPAQYCKDACAEQWEPLLAPGEKATVAYPTIGSQTGAKPPEGLIHPQKAPDWAVIVGAQGPQWVYKGWHLVFIRKGEQPGSSAYDGADDFVWNTLKFVPPAPRPVTPGDVTTLVVNGDYAFADREGRLLIAGDCPAACAGWVPLPAGMASRGLGEWSVDRGGDVPQWRFRGKPVFVSQEQDAQTAPPGAVVLRP